MERDRRPRSHGFDLQVGNVPQAPARIGTASISSILAVRWRVGRNAQTWFLFVANLQGSPLSHSRKPGRAAKNSVSQIVTYCPRRGPEGAGP